MTYFPQLCLMFTHGSTNMIIKIFQGVLVNFTKFGHFSFCCLLLSAIDKNYLQWHGPRAQLVVTEPELIKEIMNNRDNAYPKPEISNYTKKLLRDGLVTFEGEMGKDAETSQLCLPWREPQSNLLLLDLVFRNISTTNIAIISVEELL